MAVSVASPPQHQPDDAGRGEAVHHFGDRTTRRDIRFFRRQPLRNLEIPVQGMHLNTPAGESPRHIATHAAQSIQPYLKHVFLLVRDCLQHNSVAAESFRLSSHGHTNPALARASRIGGAFPGHCRFEREKRGFFRGRDKTGKSRAAGCDFDRAGRGWPNQTPDDAAPDGYRVCTQTLNMSASSRNSFAS